MANAPHVQEFIDKLNKLLAGKTIKDVDVDGQEDTLLLRLEDGCEVTIWSDALLYGDPGHKGNMDAENVLKIHVKEPYLLVNAQERRFITHAFVAPHDLEEEPEEQEPNDG